MLILAEQVVDFLLETDPDEVDPRAYLRDIAGSYARKPSAYYKARSSLFGAAKQESGAAHVARVKIVWGSAAPAITSGSRGGFFTKGGTRIHHPSAYSAKGWSNMQYLTNDEVVTVGIKWLEQQLPKSLEIYLKFKGLDDPWSPVTWQEYERQRMEKFDQVYNVDDPVLGESVIKTV